MFRAMLSLPEGEEWLMRFEIWNSTVSGVRVERFGVTNRCPNFDARTMGPRV